VSFLLGGDARPMDGFGIAGFFVLLHPYIVKTHNTRVALLETSDTQKYLFVILYASLFCQPFGNVVQLLFEAFRKAPPNCAIFLFALR
jgi:hypothetical protein